MLCLLIGAYGVGKIIYGSPGQEETVDEEQHVSPTPTPSDPALERLRQPWDSEEKSYWPVAETLAAISDIAYLPPIDAEKEFEKLGFSQMVPLFEKSMVAYVVFKDNVTVIAFRGTDGGDVSDWVVNLNTLSSDTDHGRIHSGFYDAYLAMKPQIGQALKGQKIQHLWITGHSLGGALALACAYDFLENQQKIDGIITFGQPLVTRKKLAHYLDRQLIGRYARFVNNDDLVARIPPGYTPCGSLVWFTDEGVKRSDPKRKLWAATGIDEMSRENGIEIEPLSEKEFKRLQQELKDDSKLKRTPGGQVLYEGNLPFIKDHFMKDYLDRIREHLGIRGRGN